MNLMIDIVEYNLMLTNSTKAILLIYYIAIYLWNCMKIRQSNENNAMLSGNIL